VAVCTGYHERFLRACPFLPAKGWSTLFRTPLIRRSGAKGIAHTLFLANGKSGIVSSPGGERTIISTIAYGRFEEPGALWLVLHHKPPGGSNHLKSGVFMQEKLFL